MSRHLSLRRVCQGLSFALFLLLLFYVAWPYAQRFGTRVLADKERVPAELFLWLDPLASLAAAAAARCVGPFLLWTAGILALSLLVPRVFCSHLCPLGTTVDLFDWAVGRWIIRMLRWRRSARATPCHSEPVEEPFKGADRRDGADPATGASAPERCFDKLSMTGREPAGASRGHRGGWVYTKYYILAAVLVAAALGVMLAGHVAAIPVATRGFVFVLGPAQLALLKHASMVRPVAWDYWLAIALFLCVPALGLLGRRFWCRTLCPSGALFSLVSPLRLRERRVKDSCIRCGKCVAACSFDAIRPDDFTTRPAECAFCPDCARACPVDAIEFGWRRSGDRESRESWRMGSGDNGLKSEIGNRKSSLKTGLGLLRSEPASEAPRLSRRALLGASAAGAAAAAGLLAAAPRPRLLRPPGSVREDRFLELCVRCGLCLKVCPGPVLHPAGMGAGLDALWTPVAVPSWAGCHQDCNFCGQVCPTGAIRPLPIEAKRRVHMGLAVVNPKTCLPHAGKRDCQLCFDECRAAGYHAIEMRPVGLDVGDVPEGVLSAAELEEAGRILAPFVKPDACVGCGLCEYRCGTAWAKQQRLLDKSAIAVVPENEDRPA